MDKAWGVPSGGATAVLVISRTDGHQRHAPKLD
jgi:hypothetical protein